MKVLVVDGDPTVAEGIELAFKMRWPEAKVQRVGTGREAIATVPKERPDAVLLEADLPDQDGFSVCEAIRRISETGIIMLTARASETDKAKALELGADDYVTKPFSHIEIIARVNALLRRISRLGALEEKGVFEADGLKLDFTSGDIYVRGRLVRLTPTEFKLLYLLTKDAGAVVSHRFLVHKLWGVQYPEGTEYLRIHIQHLRQRLGDRVADPRYITNVRGIGYRFLAIPRQVS